MIDFETYSEAGYIWDGEKWRSITPSPPHGIGAVGAFAYSEHQSTEVLSLAYDIGCGPQLWLPGMPDPEDLFLHLKKGGEVEAWNCQFEFLIWSNVCADRMGWPFVHWKNFRDGMPKARAYGLPGKLENASQIIGNEKKDSAGKSLIRKFCIPRNPTKNDPSLRNLPEKFPQEAQRFYEYNIQDIVSEGSVSRACPDLIPKEKSLWLLDQKINYRGIQIDREALDSCLNIVDQCFKKYTNELLEITNGKLNSPNKIAAFKTWLSSRGINMSSLSAESVESALKNGIDDPESKRALEIRQKIGNASVKKLKSIERMICRDGRLRGLFSYCGADRTGRWAGRGPQPQNLPAASLPHGSVDEALELIGTRSLDAVEFQYGDALDTIAACIRGLFVASPGSDLICGDFDSIEARVLAELAGEDWRREVFHTHGMIYEVSASKFTGVSIGEMMAFRQTTGTHHPARKMGKIGELACLAADTQVLTDSGWKRIVNITTDDLLHDGVEWVAHDGVVNKGTREVITVDGVTATPNHKFYAGGDTWVTAEDLKTAAEDTTKFYALTKIFEKNYMYSRAIGRCHNPDHQGYKDYGLRGIHVYPDWIDNRINFFAYRSLCQTTMLKGTHRQN